MRYQIILAVICLECLKVAESFQAACPSLSQFSCKSSTSHSSSRSPPSLVQQRVRPVVTASTSNKNDNDAAAADDLSALLTSRLPTSVDDQVRQATESLKRATADGIRRHCIRLLLPVIGATELDDWPGGARQMMQAADPLVQRIITESTTTSSSSVSLNKVLLDASDGVYSIMAQAEKAKDDSCTVLLPSADNIDLIQTSLDEEQVGPNRNLILVNPQWKRRSDFGSGGFFGFGGGSGSSEYAEQFLPTFSLTNLICEGDSIRILRTYPGPWRVYVRSEEKLADKATPIVDWQLVGTKPFVTDKPSNWADRGENKRDGGRLFDYGQPTYQEVYEMLLQSPNYTPKSPVERAATAFNFIKDTL